MGVIKELIHEELIPSESDRHSNLLRIYKKDNEEIVIHFRNLKINLITPFDIKEWRYGFQIALEKFKEGKFLENDI